MNYGKHFNKNEFTCSCCDDVEMDQDLVDMLNKARELAKIPFKITSAYRCESNNNFVGGVNGSSHTKGLAVDISCKTSTNRYKMMKALIDAGFKRVGISKSFIHCDNDYFKAQNVIWTY